MRYLREVEQRVTEAMRLLSEAEGMAATDTRSVTQPLARIGRELREVEGRLRVIANS